MNPIVKRALVTTAVVPLAVLGTGAISAHAAYDPTPALGAGPSADTFTIDCEHPGDADLVMQAVVNTEGEVSNSSDSFDVDGITVYASDNDWDGQFNDPISVDVRSIKVELFRDNGSIDLNGRPDRVYSKTKRLRSGDKGIAKFKINKKDVDTARFTVTWRSMATNQDNPKLTCVFRAP